MANLRDLATAAHVSIRTVNRVLKNDGYVHAKTRDAVERAVRHEVANKSCGALSL